MSTPEALRPPIPPEHYNVQVTIDHVVEAHEAPNPSIAYNRNATATTRVERKVSHVVQLTVTAGSLPEAIVKVKAHLDVHRSQGSLEAEYDRQRRASVTNRET